jgi:CheY-like chemotaxis protein
LQKLQIDLDGHRNAWNGWISDNKRSRIIFFDKIKIIKVTRPMQQEPYIIMCSAYDTVENFEEGKKVGMVNFLPKPVKKLDLEKMLKKYVGVTC